MERNSFDLASQVKNNINILRVSEVESDDGGETLSVSVCYEFQHRHKPEAAPHWVKTCDVVGPGMIRSGDQLRQYVIEQVRKARAELEG